MTSYRFTILLSLLSLLSACGGGFEGEIPKTWEEAQSMVYPQFVPYEEVKEKSLTVTSYAPDLALGYVLRHNDQYTFVADKSLNAWGIETSTLHDRAITNLASATATGALQFFPQKSQKPDYASIEMQDGYDAARFLIPSIRKQLAEQLGEPYTVAIPLRDFLIAWKNDFSDAQAFRKQVRTEYNRERHRDNGYALTPDLFITTTDGIQSVEDNAASNESRAASTEERKSSEEIEEGNSRK